MFIYKIEFRSIGISILPILVLIFSTFTGHAATLNLSDCSEIVVSGAIAAAAKGDIVVLPAKSCSWSNLTLNKAITLRGAGVDQTKITLTTNQALTVTKQPGGIVRFQNIGFFASNISSLPHPIVVNGSWQNAQPVIFQNNSFTMSGATMIDIFVAGGVIFSKNAFIGGWNDFAFTVKAQGDTNSWTEPDSMGSRDTQGLLNVYIEDNTFYGMSNGTIDCDDNCRVVMRNNVFTESGGFNSHGLATSHSGMRHFEIYNNRFLYPDPNNLTIGNINWFIWIRGGTGVIFNNYFDNLIGSTWGDKPEIRLNIRGAEDVRPQGSCSSVVYPVPRQLGQSHNGVSYITDPIYFWGNTGSYSIAEGWNWGNPCGFVWGDFFKWGRDAIQGSSPKPGYVAYTYPHPLLETNVPPPASGKKIFSTPTTVRIKN